jgi:hypothetical protein
MVSKNTFAIIAARLVMALALFSAVYWQVSDRLMHNLFRPYEYFAYFSITSALLAGAVLALSSIQLARGLSETKLLSLSRLTMAVSMVIVGVIYNALLRGGAPDARDVGYAWPVLPNEIIHTYLPVLIFLEWLFSRTTIALKMNHAFWVLVYPLSWLAFSIIRGLIQGWWPYWFIDPQYGIGTQVMWIFIIAALFSVLALGFIPAQKALAKR